MKRILELRGYKVVAEDQFNWVMEPSKYEAGSLQVPVTLPKRGALLSVDIMMDTIIKTKTDLHMYFTLKEKALEQPELFPEQSDKIHPIQ
jgi:hypothetical protein